MEPVAGHLTAADRTLPGHPVRPQDDVAAQDRTPQAADGQSADRSGSLQLPLPFLKAGPAGGRLRRPSSRRQPQYGEGEALSETPVWFLIIQVLTTITLVATFIAFLAQLRTMQKQLEVAKQSTLAQNTLAVAQFLSQPEIRASRRHMFRNLAGKSLRDWSDEDRIEAERVCSSYDVTGLLVRAGIVDRNIIVEN